MYSDSAPTEVIGRLLIIGFYLAMLIRNILSWNFHVEKVGKFLPFPTASLIAGLVVQLLGSAMVLLDYHASIGAAALIAFTVVATAIYHPFWTVRDAQLRNYHALLFSNNVAIVGGLFLLM
jgi:uncharacterized membrane protein YphA (DoxX/SURF4 family)